MVAIDVTELAAGPAEAGVLQLFGGVLPRIVYRTRTGSTNGPAAPATCVATRATASTASALPLRISNLLVRFVRS